MSDIPFDFGIEFQEQLLALMLKDLAFANKAIEHVPEEKLYSESHRFLLNQITIKLRAKGTPLTYIEVEDFLKYSDKSKRRVLKNFVRRIFEIEVENPDFIKDKLTEWAKKVAFAEIMMNAQMVWNSGQQVEAYLSTKKKVDDLYAINLRSDATVSIEKFEEVRQIHVSNALNALKKIPTTIDKLDKLLRGGLEKKELGIILAQAKAGKSLGLLHMGYAALIRDAGRVAHFVLEGTTEQTLMRYQSRFTGIRYSDLEKDELTKDELKRLEKVSKKYLGKLILVPFNKHWSYTVQDINSSINEMTASSLKPDLVIVDYGDLLKSDAHQSEKRHEQTEVFRDLKKLAMSQEVALWTACQSRRQEKDVEDTYLLRAKDISESIEKVRIADLVTTLNQTPREREDGILRFHVDIYRNNDGDQTIPLITDFSRMIFHSHKYGIADKKEDLSFPWMKVKVRKGR